MRRLSLAILLFFLSLGFVAAWLSSYADYQKEHRLAAGAVDVALSDLLESSNYYETIVRVQNDSASSAVVIGEVLKRDYDGRWFEFCSVTVPEKKRDRETSFTFCRELFPGQSDLATVLASDSFKARLAASRKLSWLLGTDEVNALYDDNPSINQSQIIIVGYEPDSMLTESSVALSSYALFAIALLIWLPVKVKSDGFWRAKVDVDQAAEVAKFPAALGLIGYDSASIGRDKCTVLRPFAKDVLPLSEGVRRCRWVATNAAYMALIACMGHVWGLPIINALIPIIENKDATSGQEFWQFAESIICGSLGLLHLGFGVVFLVLYLVRFGGSPFFNFDRRLPTTVLKERKSRSWSKGYLQFHEQLLGSLGFSRLGDYQDGDESELAFFVSSNRRVMVSIGLCSGNTGYQIYSMLSNGKLVLSDCFLRRYDRACVQKDLTGKLEHQAGGHDEFMQALEAHELRLRELCSDQVLEYEFHETNVLRFIRPQDKANKIGKLPAWNHKMLQTKSMSS